MLDRAGAVLQFIDTRVAELVDEVLLAEESHRPHEQVRVLVDGLDVIGLQHRADDLFRSQRIKGNTAQRASSWSMARWEGIAGASLRFRGSTASDSGWTESSWKASDITMARTIRRRSQPWARSRPGCRAPQLRAEPRVVRIREIIHSAIGPDPLAGVVTGVRYVDANALSERLPEQKPPDPIGNRPLEAAILRVRDPRGELPAARQFPGGPLRRNRHRGGDIAFRFSIIGQHRELQVGIIDHSRQRQFELTKVSRQPLELRLLPVIERMVVTLGAVDSLPQERTHSAGGQLVGVELVVRERPGQEVDLSLSRPHAAGGEHVGDKLIVGPMHRQLCPQPGGEAVSAKDHKLARLDSHVGSARRSAK